MTVCINVDSLLEWLAAYQWYLIAAGVVLYYMGSAVIIKQKFEVKNDDGYNERCALWLFSPLVLAFIGPILVIWTVMWIVSFGLVQPFWRC